MSAVATAGRTAGRSSWGPAWYGLLVGGTVVGLGCFVYQWINGLAVTGLSNTISWGMYIITFMFLVGISAGGLIVAAGAELVGSERFASLQRLAVLLSGTAILAAAISILPDLGRPQMVWRMLRQPHWTSPLIWDVIIISVYLTIALIDLYILTRPNPKPGALRTMAFIALPAAVLVHSITAWIFGLLVARPFWNTALMAPMFISSALVSGLGLLIVTAHVVDRTTEWEPDRNVFGDLARLMVWFIAVDGFLLFAEILTTYASRVPDHLKQLNVLLMGRLAPVFWAEVVIGVVVPFAICASRLRERRGWVVAAGALAMLGVFAKRINIVMTSMFMPLVGLAPGIPGGRAGQEFAPDPIYIPTWVEAGILLGLACFIGLLVTLGVRYLIVPERRPTG
ncbi:MAG TPA: NrfD/PsrC family molybdoenzyme membrane anchor subunit [Actinomycetota bacterium]|nr:NrfD/PsrC family molybdoenzyme membrane anchor subunit [Actinomycetota bacterium]